MARFSKRQASFAAAPWRLRASWAMLAQAFIAILASSTGSRLSARNTSETRANPLLPNDVQEYSDELGEPSLDGHGRQEGRNKASYGRKLEQGVPARDGPSFIDFELLGRLEHSYCFW
eukprot:CAMPEP_0198540872 /NCGR_PEP_ID=MMETSP1462-20131121/53444_1 /TAXON_ID=1333877 /ORGANISM="Brandtodinium nutriculum, Strain RCC3387" /LENGTH=117 /DNA_ID=CAMNT_0044271011 /DNA_START=53 /DNA_END=403 /DNA_ORIENTATION=-